MSLSGFFDPFYKIFIYHSSCTVILFNLKKQLSTSETKIFTSQNKTSQLTEKKFFY